MKRSMLVLVLSVALLLAAAAPAFASSFSFDGYCYNYFNSTGSATFYTGYVGINATKDTVIGPDAVVEYYLYDGNGFFGGSIGVVQDQTFSDNFPDYLSGTHYNTHLQVKNTNYSGTSSRIHSWGSVYQ